MKSDKKPKMTVIKQSKDNQVDMFPEKKVVEMYNPKAWMCRNA